MKSFQKLNKLNKNMDHSVTKSCLCKSRALLVTNKPGMAQVGAPSNVQKSKVSCICKGHFSQTFIKLTVPKNTRRDRHKTRTPLFPNVKHQKLIFSEKINSEFFSGQKSHSAEKEALRSPNAFFRPKTFIKM